MSKSDSSKTRKMIAAQLSVLIVMTFFLISLGGAVRAAYAGLSCPDWPLCFGEVIPDYQIQVYYEFIHRVLAGLVAIFAIYLAIRTWKLKNSSEAIRTTVIVALGVLVIQIIMGGLTVLEKLKPYIVTSHLGLGMSFFSSLLWWRFQLGDSKRSKNGKMPLRFQSYTILSLIVVFCQIILGGLVSTNYAGVACPDFPLCMGELIPTLSGLQGLQVIHRLGAYTVAIVVTGLYLYASQRRNEPWMDVRYFNLTGWMLIAVFIQIGVGISNVLFKTPPLITVTHLAVAATILGCNLRLLYLSRLNAMAAE